MENRKQQNFESLAVTEGVIKQDPLAESTAWCYHYYLKDHLGSTKMVIDGDNALVYAAMSQPYGKEMPLATSLNPVREKFTGKELDEDGKTEGVNGAPGIQMCYFGARFYDADVGVWAACDPMREYYSSYTYVGNNPIRAIDPDGQGAMQVGLSSSGGASLGVKTSSGFIIGYSKENGFQFGTYGTAGVGGTLDFELGVSPWMLDINDAGGVDIATGGSFLVAGAEVSVPMDQGGNAAIAKQQSTLNLSIGIKASATALAEGHTMATTTAVQDWGAVISNFFGQCVEALENLYNVP